MTKDDEYKLIEQAIAAIKLKLKGDYPDETFENIMFDIFDVMEKYKVLPDDLAVMSGIMNGLILLAHMKLDSSKDQGINIDAEIKLN